MATMSKRPVVINRELGASGSVAVRKLPPTRPWPLTPLTSEDILRYGQPNDGAAADINAWRHLNAENLERGARQWEQANALELRALFGELWLRVFRADGSVQPLGLASLRVVTNAGVAFIVDAFQNLKELENLKFHGIGTGTNAEAVGDTALQTELTTQLNPNSTRATGTTTENAANIYETVATNEVDATVAITEHGIFDQAATGGGTLLDRSVFAAVNLDSGDRLETTYRFTVTAGS
jgi:hypothetical protein